MDLLAQPLIVNTASMVISTHILVESPQAESDEQFCAAIENMVLQTYGRRPDWLRFSVGARFAHDGRCFREFACMAGSVAMILMSRAKREGGFPRSIIYRADDDATTHAYEIRSGVETEFSPDELKAA